MRMPAVSGFAVYVLIAVFIAWPSNTGMFFHDMQAHRAGYRRAEFEYRDDLGKAVIFGALFSVAWPVQVPLAWLATGFAQHGLWSQTEPPEHQRPEPIVGER